METKPDYVQDEITNPNKSKVNMNAKATYVPDEITNLGLLTYIYIYIWHATLSLGSLLGLEPGTTQTMPVEPGLKGSSKILTFWTNPAWTSILSKITWFNC